MRPYNFLILLFLIVFFCCKKQTDKHVKLNLTTEKVEVKTQPLDTLNLKCITKESVIHTEISNVFNFKSKIKKYKSVESDSFIVTVNIIDKKSNQNIQTITIQTNFLLGDSTFFNKNIRSYTTGYNLQNEIVDGEFGDIIVADFNFDNIEDLAIKRDEGGNGGSIYNFYIQNSNKTFKIDKFLSETVMWFPYEFNKKQKQLITLVHASAVSTCETTYSFDSKTNSWKQLKERFVGI